MEGWVKRAKMELVSMCQQLVKAMCQFVKAVMCRVSTYSTGTRPFEGFAQGLRRQSGNDNDRNKDKDKDNDNDNENDKWLVRQVQEQETIDDPSEGYMLRQFWLA